MLQIFWFCLKCTESETLGAESNNLCLNKHPPNTSSFRPLKLEHRCSWTKIPLMQQHREGGTANDVLKAGPAGFPPWEEPGLEA